tara:strand:+ start:7838 stop:8284 length:447 start_codon:yes stop_codon:yes gene_type:complete
MKDFLKLTGRVNLKLIGPDGSLKDERDVDNLVVTTGLNHIASRIKDATATAMTHYGVGQGQTAAAANNTDLENIIGSRVALTSTTVTNNEVVYVADFGAGVSTGAITEAAVFNASSGQTMLARVVFSTINKAAADTLQITHTITISAS